MNYKKFNQTSSRRSFLQFMGRLSAGALLAPQLIACASRRFEPRLDLLPFQPIAPTKQDSLVLAEGLSYRPIVSWKDIINKRNETFGFNNDYLNWTPLPHLSPEEEVLLWVNHESVDPFIMFEGKNQTPPSKEQVLTEMKAVGGSILHLERQPEGWRRKVSSVYNRRVSGETPIPFVAPRKIMGESVAIGTLANCAGGKTPDNLILTCEENYDQFYGEIERGKNGERIWKKGIPDFGWHKYFNRPPEHYGWVVEVNPLTGKARKLTSLGRFCHESATVSVAKDGRWVVYSGDDHNDECLYKFISSKPGSLTEGQLYVANIETDRWLPLDWNSPLLKPHFSDPLEVLIHTREAAHRLGGSRLNRPEDVEIDPVSGAVLVALTNNKAKGDPHGSILKIIEAEGDPASLEFSHEVFLTGGRDGFSCPDNMAFDHRGDLWITTDISASSLNNGSHSGFGNNALFYVPMSGPNAGGVFQVASAPNGAEFTGPCFAPEKNRLFLSVQHPGEGSANKDALKSHWPKGGTSWPQPTVVEIHIPFLS